MKCLPRAVHLAHDPATERLVHVAQDTLDFWTRIPASRLLDSVCVRAHLHNHTVRRSVITLAMLPGPAISTSFA